MKTKIYRSSKQNRVRSKGVLYLLGGAVLLVAIAILAYTFVFNKDTQSTDSGVINSTEVGSQSADDNGKEQLSSQPTSTKDPGLSDQQSSSSVKLTEAPSGTFVSNHKPNLSGSPAPSSEQSTCNTLPGASCYIKFVKDDIVKTLPSQIADSNGSSIWSWDIKKAGFSEGTWEITAISTLNGKSLSTTDTLKLEVGQ